MSYDPRKIEVVVQEKKEKNFGTYIPLLACFFISILFLPIIISTPLRNLVEQIELDERFSFTFQGNSQVLDHILVGPPLACSSEAEFIHVGPTIFATNPSVSGLRDGSVTPSDHDPIVAAIEL